MRLALVGLALLVAGCATSSKSSVASEPAASEARSPVGEWDFAIVGEMGAFDGTLNLAPEGSTTTMSVPQMGIQDAEYTDSTLEWDGKNLTFSGLVATIQGSFSMQINATMLGDTLIGELTATPQGGGGAMAFVYTSSRSVE